jgi:hypothetical protein
MHLPSPINLTCPLLSRRGTCLDAAVPFSESSPWMEGVTSLDATALFRESSPWLGGDRGGCEVGETALPFASHRSGTASSPIDLSCSLPSLSTGPSLTWSETYSVRLKATSNRGFLRALRSDAPPPWIGGDRGGCAVGETNSLSDSVRLKATSNRGFLRALRSDAPPPWIGGDRAGCEVGETVSLSAVQWAGAAPSLIDLTCSAPPLSLGTSLTWSGTYSVRLKANLNRGFLRGLRSDAPPPWIGGDRGGCEASEAASMSAVHRAGATSSLINLTCPLLSRRGTCLDAAPFGESFPSAGRRGGHSRVGKQAARAGRPSLHACIPPRSPWSC